MNDTQHVDLAAGRWQTMTLAEQLGNVGSEYSRARRWHEKGNADFFEKAFVRFLELMDLTVTDVRWRGPRRRELSRVRGAVCAELLGIDTSSAGFTRYFDAMVVASRRIVSEGEHH